MINYRIVAKILGILLFLEAILLLGCSLLPLCSGESDLVAFLVSVASRWSSGWSCFCWGGR